MSRVPIHGLLKLGDTGPAVVGLQVMLTGYSYTPGPIDGFYGPKTAEAVRAYQRRQGIDADSIVGPQTWGRLTKQEVGQVVTKASEVPSYSSLASVRTAKIWTIDGKKVWKVWPQGKSTLEYVRGSGCALSSTLMAAYPFRSGVPTPTTFHKSIEKKVTGRSDSKSGCPLAPAGAVKVLKYYGINAVWKPYKVSRSDIHQHLVSGRPVLVWLVDKSGRYTSYLHTVLLAGVADNGRWIMLDSGGRKLNGSYSVKLVDPADIYKYIHFCTAGKKSDSYYWRGESSTTGIVLVDP